MKRGRICTYEFDWRHKVISQREPTLNCFPLHLGSEFQFILWIFLFLKLVNKIATGRSLSNSGFLLLCFLKEFFSSLPPPKRSVITRIQLMRNLSFGSYNVWRTGALTISSNNLKFTTLIFNSLGITEINLFCNCLFSWQALS